MDERCRKILNVIALFLVMSFFSVPAQAVYVPAVLAPPAAWSASAAKRLPQKYPKIALVLGGGGARGAAHIGVLKVLEELYIPVDYVVGTSMGAIVGGLYASGMSPQEIDCQMRAMNWDDLFHDAPDREDRTFRRKREDDYYTVKYKPGLNNGEFNLPLAIIRGQKLDLELSRLTIPIFDIKNYDKLPIPYRAVATDAETGREVVMSSGDLPRSIRASMAVPAVFDPVEIDGKMLIDGGISNNVPINVAKAMGADVVIVVDVGGGLYKRGQIKNVIDVAAQLTNFLFTLNTDTQLALLTDRDVLIKPQLGDIGSDSFNRVGEAIPLGEQAARQMAKSLSKYSLGRKEYAKRIAKYRRSTSHAPIIEFIHIDNHSKVDDDIILCRITAELGQPLDETQLKKDIGSIYGLEIFQTVTYEVVEENGQRGLLIHAQEKWWGPGYIQPGLEYSNVMGKDGVFNIGALYTKTEINALNGEWRLGVQVGDEPGIFMDLYQPLDALNTYFGFGKVGYITQRRYQFDDNSNELAIFNLGAGDLEVAGGANLGTWGEARLGYVRQFGNISLQTGQPVPDHSFNTGYAFLRLFDDKMDSLYFPTKGHLGIAQYLYSRKDLGADTNFEQLALTYNHAFTWREKNTLIGGLIYNTTIHNNAPIQSQFTAGGFLRLSGLIENQLVGQNMGVARLIYMRHVRGGGKFFPGYIGGSLEMGNVWQRHHASLGDTVKSASIFIGFDTALGPVYLGLGHASTGDTALYLRLGPLIRSIETNK